MGTSTCIYYTHTSSYTNLISINCFLYINCKLLHIVRTMFEKRAMQMKHFLQLLDFQYGADGRCCPKMQWGTEMKSDSQLETQEEKNKYIKMLVWSSNHFQHKNKKVMNPWHFTRFLWFVFFFIWKLGLKGHFPNSVPFMSIITFCWQKKKTN